MQEARTELGLTQVSAEPFFTAAAGRSRAAAQCSPCANRSVPPPLFWVCCHSLYKDKTLVKSVLVLCSSGFSLLAGAQEGCTLPQQVRRLSSTEQALTGGCSALSLKEASSAQAAKTAAEAPTPRDSASKIQGVSCTVETVL